MIGEISSFIWNEKMTRYVRLSAIREFRIDIFEGSRVLLTAWLSRGDSFRIGIYRDKDTALRVLNGILSTEKR